MKLVHVFLGLMAWACLAEWTTAAEEKKEKEEEERDLRKVDVDFSDPEATKKWVNAILEKGKKKRKRIVPAVAAVAAKVLPMATSLLGGGGGAAAAGGAGGAGGAISKLIPMASNLLGGGGGAAPAGGAGGIKGALGSAVKDNMGKIVEGGLQAGKDILAGKPPWATPAPLQGIDMMIRPGQGMINNTDLDLPLFEIKTDLITAPEAAPPPPTAQTPTAAPNPFAMGLGMGMMNGCYGSGYKFGDPCYAGAVPLWWCENLMEAATYVGVGFDGRGVYGPESRKANVLEYRCKMKQFYIGMSGKREDVPDPMQIAGIYDTEASSRSFASKSTYRKYLEFQAGASASFILFSGSLEAAYGSETMSQTSKYLSIYQISIKRFEVYLAKYEAKMLEPNLVREFMDLPSDYYTEGAPLAYQEFILRWGTHVVISAEFGGHLEIQQTSQQNKFQNKQEFQMKSEFAALGLLGMRLKASLKTGTSNTFVENQMSMRVQVQGGNAQIAQMIADGYSRDVKNDLHDWILSLDEFPKPYRFRLKKLTELFRFGGGDLFSSEDKTFGCEANQDRLTYEPETGQHYYWMRIKETDPATNKSTWVKTKKFCPISQRKQLTDQIREKRIALELAMATYFRQGSIAFGTFDMKGRKDCFSRHNFADKSISPSWNKLLHVPFRLRLMLPADITNTHSVVLHKLDEFKGHFSFRQSMWYYEDTDTGQEMPLLDAHVSKTLAKKQVAIAGLYLTFNETTGLFTMTQEDYQLSKVKFPNVPNLWTDGRVLGFAELYHEFHSFPCYASFNNGQRISYPKNVSNCLRFMAATEGSMYVVMAGSPEYKASWYTTVITPNGIAMYKGDVAKKTDHSFLVMGLGSRTLYQPYFVCIEKVYSKNETYLILEYGKSEKATSAGIVYVTYVDTENVFIPTYYAFGVGEKSVSITRAKQVRVPLNEKVCGPRLKLDTELQVCLDEGCHEQCHPIAGCNPPKDGIVHSRDCVRCKNLKDIIKGVQHCVTECRKYGVPTNGVCVLQCPTDRIEWDGDCVCTLSMKTSPDTCVNQCPDLMLPMSTSVTGAFQCECEIEDNGTCVTQCNSSSALYRTSAPGFYQCRKLYRGRVDIFPGKYIRQGYTVSDITTPEGCAQFCAAHNNLAGNYCQAFSWVVDGPQCTIHWRQDACGRLEDNRLATHFKRMKCDWLSDGNLDAVSRRDQPSYTQLIDEGIRDTLYDCRDACTGNCIGVNYNVDTGLCEQVRPNPQNNWCPTAKKYSFNHLFVLRQNGLDKCTLVACTNLFHIDLPIGQGHCLQLGWCVRGHNSCRLRVGFWWMHASYSVRFHIWKEDAKHFSYK